VAPLTGEYGYGHRRLRIGYLSSDFCSHAVSILTAELYELHDRSQFEVYAFSWSREDGSPIRARVVAPWTITSASMR
jgi:predicted O-linked N-acetylglucosamine transferase (SPINDLY family)